MHDTDNIDFSEFLEDFSNYKETEDVKKLSADLNRTHDELFNMHWTDLNDKEYKKKLKEYQKAYLAYWEYYEQEYTDNISRLGIKNGISGESILIYEPHKTLTPEDYTVFKQTKDGIENTHRRLCKMINSRYTTCKHRPLEVYCSKGIDRANYLSSANHMNLPPSQSDKFMDQKKNKLTDALGNEAGDVSWRKY